MSTAGASPPPTSRLQRLLGYLDHDPANLRLLADAAGAAVDEGAPDTAVELIERYGKLAPTPPALMNLAGLAAIDRQRYGEACAIFEALREAAPGDPQLRFNLAWAKAMLDDWEGALALLDDAAMEAAPRAPTLRVQMLHQLGRLEDALAIGQGLAERFPTDETLMGALAAVAIDAEDKLLADYYARRAGREPDGLAARGLLELDQDRVAASLPFFDAALSAYPSNARARLGKGLALMAQGDAADAAAEIDQAAELFRTHLGSWVAAGWAYFIRGDYATSRARFERALAIDDTFAEVHGGLAVLDAVEGRIDSAQRRAEVALRLDRNCFSAALAKVMLLSRQGDARSAARVRDIALNTPIGGAGGRTIGQAIASLGLARRGGR
jgi:tetratricopeptide (TPR) repeat protein